MAVTFGEVGCSTRPQTMREQDTIEDDAGGRTRRSPDVSEFLWRFVNSINGWPTR